jgi:transcriptional regulator with XRE-family HTH domain
MTSGQRIKERREFLKLRQGELAKLAGISQSTLSELESGESKMPSAKALMGLSKALNVTQAWIITGKDGEVDVLSEDEETLILQTRKLTLEQRRAVYQIIKTMGDD